MSKKLKIVIIVCCVVFLGVIIGLIVCDRKRIRDERDYLYTEGKKKTDEYHQNVQDNLNDFINSESDKLNR